MTTEELDAEYDRAIREYADRVERPIGEGRYFEACVGFCHEDLQVHRIAGWDDPAGGYVRFGFCSADVRVPVADLPEHLRPDAYDSRGLYSMDEKDWPDVMKAAMRPLAEHALAILRQGGSGC